MEESPAFNPDIGAFIAIAQASNGFDSDRDLRLAHKGFKRTNQGGTAPPAAGRRCDAAIFGTDK